jgi:hypothetical protein
MVIKFFWGNRALAILKDMEGEMLWVFNRHMTDALCKC